MERSVIRRRPRRGYERLFPDYPTLRYAPSGRPCCRLQLRQNPGELLPHSRDQFRARAGDGWEILEPFERAAGVDHGTGVGRTCLVEQRVERRRPGAAEELDVLRRIAT